MKDGFRQCMAWLHTWSGLLVGWILFAVFLTGTTAYVRPEISYWMRPEINVSVPGPQNAEVAIAAMQQTAPNSPLWVITLPTARETAIRVFWRDPTAGGRGFRNVLLDPDSGKPLEARATEGGEFFYAFHFQLHYIKVIWGRWIVSICAMFMLIAIVSGIITHRRIFVDFFTFRPGKGQRSWLDGHNVAAVLALPYHLMITYTGLVIFMAMVMPWGIDKTYPNDRAAFNAEVYGSAQPQRRAGQPAPLVPIVPLLEAAQRQWGGKVGRIAVNNPGDASSTIQLTRADSERVSYNPQQITFSGTTGAIVSASSPDRPAAETRGVMTGLHIGRFAGPFLRALFILAGAAGTVMVATGCVLWAVKERQQALKKGKIGFGTRLVEHLNVAAIAGLPVAMAAYFWANRLLPVGMAERAEWEIHCFFAAWALCLLHPLLRPGRRAWVEQFAAGALLFATLPLLDAVVTRRHLVASFLAGDWVRFWFELGLIAAGAVLGALAWKVAHHKSKVPARKTARSSPPPLGAETTR